MQSWLSYLKFGENKVFFVNADLVLFILLSGFKKNPYALYVNFFRLEVTDTAAST